MFIELSGFRNLIKLVVDNTNLLA